MLTRIPPKLPPEMEARVTATIGCAIRVHKGLGPGFKEPIYHDAMKTELTASALSWRSEVDITVYYRGAPTRAQKVDLIVDGFIIVEIKAVEHLHPVHQAQILSYLKAARLPIGLLMNFNTTHLKSQLRRFVM